MGGGDWIGWEGVIGLDGGGDWIGWEGVIVIGWRG